MRFSFGPNRSARDLFLCPNRPMFNAFLPLITNPFLKSLNASEKRFLFKCSRWMKRFKKFSFLFENNIQMKSRRHVIMRCVYFDRASVAIRTKWLVASVMRSTHWTRGSDCSPVGRRKVVNGTTLSTEFRLLHPGLLLLLLRLLNTVVACWTSAFLSSTSVVFSNCVRCVELMTVVRHALAAAGDAPPNGCKMIYRLSCCADWTVNSTALFVTDRWPRCPFFMFNENVLFSK